MPGLEPATRDFDDYCARVSPALVAQLSLVVGNREDARDIVQEALLRTWREWERVRAYELPEAFTRRVAYNLATARWRRLQSLERVTRLLSRDGGSRANGFAEDLADELDLLAALRRLPIAQRQALVLHDVAGLSAEEIAGEMGVRGATVRSWLLRGRRRVARALAPAPEADAPGGPLPATAASQAGRSPLVRESARGRGSGGGEKEDER